MEVADQGMMIPLPANGLYFPSLGLVRPANADLVNINSKVACDDPIVDQNQDSGDRRRNDRPHGHYRGAVADIGDPSWSSARADDKQLYSSLWKPGAQQYPLAGKGLGASPHGDRKVSVAAPPGNIFNCARGIRRKGGGSRA